MRWLLILLLVIPVFPCALAQPAPAAVPGIVSDESEDAAETPQQRVDETIVVTATRSRRQVSELPVSTTVITQSQVETAPVKTVDDLIRTIPGITMPVTSSVAHITVSSVFSMRGLGETRALLLLDGVPLHDPFYGTVQWAKVPLDSVKQVEVVRGAGAGLFGNFALGGVVNLITRPIEESRIRLDTSLGSFGTDRMSLSLDHVVSPRLGLRLTHSRFDSSGYYRQLFRGAVDIPGWNDTSVTGARAELTLSEATRAFAKVSSSDIHVSQGTPLVGDQRDIFDAAAGFQHAIGSRVLLNGSFFRQRSEERLTSSRVAPNRGSESLLSDATIPSSSTGASLEWSLQRSGTIPFVSVGVDLQRLEADERRDNYSAGAVASRNVIHGAQQFTGVFAQASWRPSAKLEILTSARLDRYRNYDGRDAVVGGTVKSYDESTATELNPRVSFRYAAGERSAFRGAVYSGFKAPTLRALYREAQVGTSTILANPYLEPETLAGGEIGFEHAFRGGRVEMNVFRSEIEGVQVRTHAPGQPANVSINLNLGKARSQGVELMASFDLTQRIAVDASYAYTDSTVLSDPNPDLVGKLLPDVIPHAGSLALRYRGQAGTSVALRARTASRSYGEAQNAVPSPAHEVFDVSLSHPVRSWLEVYALFENVTDELYYQVISTTTLRVGQPRSVTGGVRLTLATGRTRP